MGRGAMSRTVGVLVMEHIAAGLVDGNKVVGPLKIFPESPQSLDPKEGFCGCGGKGHLEGILGRRSMRMRFLDLEPEEVFENARAGDARCAEFVQLCHRALAAATATSIHMEGPGTFFITGLDTKFIDTGLLDRLVHEMVKMSPLQGSRFEVLPASDELGILGAAVNASHAAK